MAGQSLLPPTTSFSISTWSSMVVWLLPAPWFLEALRLIVHRFAKGKGTMGGAIDLVFRLLTVALVFLCTVAVYHLFRGEKAGLFSLSQEAVVTLSVLLLCLGGDYLRRHMRHGKRGGGDA